jgi:hypothetical protein
MFIGVILLFIDMYITGFAFLIPGFLLATFRQRLTVDKTKKKIEKKWGLFTSIFPVKILSTNDVKSVVIFHQVTKNIGYTTRKSHTYRLEIVTEDKTIDIWSWPIDDDAYKAADAIAKLLQVNRYTRTHK